MSQEIRVILDKFVPRSYQLPLVTAIESGKFKRVVAVLPRRAGKDVAAFNVMVRMALRRVGVYYYIFPTFTQAKRVIWQSVLNDGKKFLDFIPPELIQGKNESELRINLKNGSVIQLVGSDNYDGLVGTNPCGLVFSEYALQDPRAYQFLRPILAANDGWSIFISCVAPKTLVITKKGLRRIKDVCDSREEYTDFNKPIYGLKGFHNAEQFYYGGEQDTLVISLSGGFSLECTPIHPIWDGNKWKQAHEFQEGDRIPVQYGQHVYGDGVTARAITSDREYREMVNQLIRHPDFFYVLGMIYAVGVWEEYEIIVESVYPETSRPLLELGFITCSCKETCSEPNKYSIYSPVWKHVLRSIGYSKTPSRIRFPDVLFCATKKQIRSFLQGLFDATLVNYDKITKDVIALHHDSFKFLQDLQVVLLNEGIVSYIHKCHPGFDLRIRSYFSWQFYKSIGFRVPCRQKRKSLIKPMLKKGSGNSYPIDAQRLNELGIKHHNALRYGSLRRRTIESLYKKYSSSEYLKKLVEEKFYYATIKSIEHSRSEVFDFVIPETHSFFSNGIMSHNTPRGKNHFYDLYQLAQDSPDWFAYKLTLDDTKHIPMEEIERERREGLMSEDLILQEYYTSFDMGIEGSYYGKYMDKMRLDQRIGDVPHEPSSLVHTAWDIGVRDSTCIIFFQTIGNTIRIIDCYENSKVGLEHYVKLIQSKPYAYGKHIAPHDIKVQEFGSGITRIEKARQLGIKFIIAPDLSIEDGIETVRSTLPRVWIDSRCQSVIKALDHYRQEYDPKKKVYKQHPLHDIYSHMADALRYLSISIPQITPSMTAEELNKRYHRAMYGNNSQLPPFFRD